MYIIGLTQFIQSLCLEAPMQSTADRPAQLPRETWLEDLTQRPQPAVDWVWHGYLAKGALTLLTSQWKTGKTTLASVLISNLANGGELAGQTVRSAGVAVVSEEPDDFWLRRAEKHSFGKELCFFCQPFGGRPSLATCDALIDRLIELRHERGVDVVVVDPLTTFLPAGVENRADGMLEVVGRLSRLTKQGQAVLVLHHPTKGASTAGQLARGSGALSASADILMEMGLVSSALETDRRRRLAAWSRFEATPRRLLIELAEDGCQYRAILEGEHEDMFTRHWPAVERLLACPPRKLSRQELLTAWRAKSTAPSPTTLWRVLDTAVQRGLLVREGGGNWTDPYRYWLAVLPSEWETTQEDPAAGYWPIVQCILTSPPRKLSRRQLLEKWPRQQERSDVAMLIACLEQSVASGRLKQESTGQQRDPIRYYIDGIGATAEFDINELLGPV